MHLQEQEQTKEGRDMMARLERLEDGLLRISWSSSAAAGLVEIYRIHPSSPDESVVHMAAVDAESRHYIFADPQLKERACYRIRFADGKAVTTAERVLPLEGAVNFRDLGGYRTGDGRSIRWGKLYRSADLSCLTEEDIAYLQSLELAWICDLRSDAELQLSPSPSIGAAVNEQLSFLASANPNEMMRGRQITVNMLAEMNRGMIGNTALTAEYFRRLLKKDGAPTLFHCAAGKDRTGFIASVVLQALGVDREDILEDYALTNQFTERFKEQMSGQRDAHAEMLGNLEPEVIKALMSAKPEYLAAAFEEMDERYGNFEGYWLNGLGLEMEELEKLRSLYLE